MYMAIAAAASSALDLLSSLTSSKSTAKKAGVTQSASSAFDTLKASGSTPAQIISSSSATQGGALSPTTLSALFSAQDPSRSSASSRSAAMKDLFGQLDGNGDGAISKSEFETKLGAGGTNIANADKVFGELDSNGDGSVSLNELASALKTRGGHAHGAGGKGGGADALMQALDGTSSTTVTNSDGSTTTTTTYADGSTATQNTPAGAPASNGAAATSASSKYNLIDQLLQKQAQALATSARQSLSVSV